MFEVRDRPQMVEKALLVRICFDKREEEESRSLLGELGELVDTLGIRVVDTQLVRAREMHKKFLCGTGKAAEVSDHARELGCDCIVFDNELAPSQQREWEEAADMTVIDREEVILDIFARRAQTREARLQVELARMEYALPRMARMWGHLDREGGGGSGGSAAARGMGEQQIEVDRRLARKRIDRIKSDLEAVRRQRATQRKERQKSEAPHAAIVGYTNAGKSTLLNRLAGSEILEADMLFATLDPTTRRIDLPDGQELLLTDTVGFVRNLPHRLVEAFKATLEEAVLADFLVHVLDASEPELERLCGTTLEVMAELGAEDKPVLTVLNKIDRLEDPQRLKALQALFPEAVSISARSGEGLDTLQHTFIDYLSQAVTRRRYRIPQHRGDLISLLHAEAKVLETVYEGNDVVVEVLVSSETEGRLRGIGEVEVA
ncbi:MAG: GTPase HflX [Roseibacillus sp.]|jgi:GTP-binding protein HflX|nr:GTPase HflX [Roseibacillus sp.]MCP4728646.1 GTPase HflX [Roseibacillus sp.]MDP7495253.1 GTPase HflX [Roseibacillus sp.]MDP7656846.1 GTPase HflX [Roseibacillus sp.]HJM63631.1 GTPase HflX [Roseibacillus sp.]|tara:strand:+ start:2830 stop:4128 length:1299 start_codon:yes stop_codon:yes gene_type:complete